MVPWPAMMCGSSKAEMKVGVINTVKLMEEAPQAKDAQSKIESEFAPREKELVELQGEIASLQAALEALTAAEAQVESLLERLARTIEKRRAWVQADQLGRARRDIERTRSALARVQAMREELMKRWFTIEKQYALRTGSY